MLAARPLGRLASKRLLATRATSGTMTLVDSPVSNNGARVRFVIRKKGIDSQFTSVGPADAFGGIKSPEYLRLNPQGKFPMLVLPDGKPLPESEVIVQYLLDTYKGVGPDLVADTPYTRAVAALVTRIHDIYIVPIQACMYRGGLSAQQRADQLKQIAHQLDAIEAAMLGGPFIAGPNITTADGALFPTVVFMRYILPKHFGWADIFAGRPKLAAWWAAVSKDPVAASIIAEIQGGLEGWDKGGRWEVQGIKQQVAENPELKWAY